MKKLLLIMLLIVGGVNTMNAWNYLKGSFNSWAAESPAYCLDNGPVAVYLEASETAYQFGINAGGSWKGPNNNAAISETTTISSFSDSNNFSLTVTISGYYVFSTSWDDGNLSLTVRFPNTTVYFYNALNWENVYLHDGWWNDASASNKNALRGIAMTAGANNIYSAYIPRESFYRVTFTSDKQVNEGAGEYGSGYNNFYSTNVVWNANEFNTNYALYVPTTTLSETLNNCSYYYGGTWHAYPTYTRDITDGNFGTICLPFAATVTGATIYEITSKVMDGETLTGINLNTVENLEAGHAYIFKATSNKLTATYTGSYTDATQANGMMGNLSSAPLTVSEGNYVVNGNKLREVVSGGSGVTIGQYKAYINLEDVDVSSARAANFIGFDDDVVTSIENVENGISKNTVYNLQGQRVSDSQKGLLIVNGKKILR